jgi:cytochrome c556
MKRLVCVASMLAILGVAAGARTDDPPTIKDVMDKLHKGASSPLAKLKTALKASSPDWSAVQDLTKEFEEFGAALAKNDPPRGEKADFEKLAKAYEKNAKALNAAAKAEDKAKAKAALTKITDSCKTCHTAHKGQ